MIGQATLVLAIVAVIAVITSGGFNNKALFIFTFVAVLLGISYYFGSRKSLEPSKTEKIAALIWLIIRRIVGFVGTIFFFGVAIKYLFFSEVLLHAFWPSIAVIAAGIFCIWVAVYGQGWNRIAWKDDVALHTKMGS
jgi:hypothetical protein